MRTGHAVRESIVVLAAAACLTSPLHAQKSTARPILLTAWAVNLAHADDAINIQIDRWSTAHERDVLIDTLHLKGQMGLFNALQAVPVKGRMSIPNRRTVGWDLQYAWQEPLPDGGSQIIIAAPRHISAREVAKADPRAAYPFIFIQVRLNANGEGEGDMAEQSKLAVDRENFTQLENYAAEPIRLKSVKIEKTS